MQFFTIITAAFAAFAAASPLRAASADLDSVAMARREAAIADHDNVALMRRAEALDSINQLAAVAPQVHELLKALADAQNPTIASADFNAEAAGDKVKEIFQNILNAIGGADGIKNIIKTVVGLIPGASAFQGVIDTALNVILPLIPGLGKGNNNGAAPATGTNSTTKAFSIETVKLD